MHFQILMEFRFLYNLREIIIALSGIGMLINLSLFYVD